MRQTQTGKIAEVIYARLEPGEDLLLALWDICKENDVQTGLLLDATGAMDKVLVQRWPSVDSTTQKAHSQPDIDFVEIPGPAEITAQGIIGLGAIPDQSVPRPEILAKSVGQTGFGPFGFEGDGTPYIHVHITVTNGSETVCGHLMEGSPIHGAMDWGAGGAPSHFTVVIGKVTGVVLNAVWDASGFYHDLVATESLT
jgi:predicted DNA-binding protein with PD1-like motif